MTSLKDPVSELGEGSPEFGVQPGPPDNSAEATHGALATARAAVDREAASPTAPAPVLPAVMPAFSTPSSSLDFVPIVRAEVIYGRPAEAKSETTADAVAAPPVAQSPLLPTVMPAYSDSTSALDFVRVVRAEVIYERAPEPAPPLLREHAPVIPVSASPRVEHFAPAAAMTVDPSPAPPLPFPAPSPAPVAKSIPSTWRRWVTRAAKVIVGLMVGYATLVLALIVAYRAFDPPLSTLMLELHLRGEEVDYRPVPLTSISSYLQRAVVTSEDARFCRHHGVDWGALAEAIQDSRGGSTITMQTAKNLFLWPSRSYIRKAIEIPIALAIDFAWPKRRILEIYLNIAEWGPGIFGAEAAAQYHFNKPASRLTTHEATLLAAVLPNPIARDAGDPGRVTALLAARLRGRMANSDAYVSCLGLRPTPRAEPVASPKLNPTAAPKAAPRPSANWQTRTEPAKPETPAFNPWQN